MAHLLRRLGAVALHTRRTAEGKVVPPLISRDEAMTLREQFYRDGQWVKRQFTVKRLFIMLSNSQALPCVYMSAWHVIYNVFPHHAGHGHMRALCLGYLSHPWELSSGLNGWDWKRSVELPGANRSSRTSSQTCIYIHQAKPVLNMQTERDNWSHGKDA